MQRFSAFLLLLLALAVGGCASAPAETRQSARPVAPQAQPESVSPSDAETRPLLAPPPIEGGATIGPTGPAAAPAGPRRSIALLLPLKSSAFGAAAKAVRLGFMAAAETHPENRRPAVNIFATGDQPEEILAAYRLALEAGSHLVVGPLTRTGVTALAESGLASVPTLALNMPEGEAAASRNLYLFGLSIEGEARQVARMASSGGKTAAITVTAATSLAKRSQQAFAREWQALGGKIAAQYTVSPDLANLAALREALASQAADAVFLSADFEKARLIRPYVPVAFPVYATSQINNGEHEPSRNVDLNGVQFIDMPWLLQPDHPAVMAYPRPDASFSVDLQRLYALGIDAYRLAGVILGSTNGRDVVLDGVTGQIRFGADHQVQRQLSAAMFSQGEAVVLEAPAQ